MSQKKATGRFTCTFCHCERRGDRRSPLFPAVLGYPPVCTPCGYKHFKTLEGFAQKALLHEIKPFKRKEVSNASGCRRGE